MKLSTFTSTVFGALFLFATKAVADIEFFQYPAPNGIYRPGKNVQFVVDDMPDGDGDYDRVYADLFTENGKFVKTIKSWSGDYIDRFGDNFAFSWTIDPKLKSGSYFIEIYSDDDDDYDDVSRSFIFEVAAPIKPTTPQQPNKRPMMNNGNRGGNGAGAGNGAGGRRMA
ncbi:hypothetical protein BD770DRAFT_407812 [Pilaira anomala]|nr:hypothetical protein BD770DRAFT_407812 [Pilaira anomala]